MVAIVISDKVGIKFKMITRDKKLSLYDDKGDNSSREQNNRKLYELNI